MNIRGFKPCQALISMDFVLDGGSLVTSVAGAEGSYTFRIPQPDQSTPSVVWVTLLDYKPLNTPAEAGSEIVQAIKVNLENSTKHGRPDIRATAESALESIRQSESRASKVP